jgi:hypothetical protein
MKAGLALALVAACGRGGFDHLAQPDLDAAIDANNIPPAAHHYRLADSYTDEFGGPSLLPLGGRFDAQAYRFAANQGLSLTGAMPIDVYTIDLSVALDDTSMWRKLIDFKALAVDAGVYINDAKFAFVEETTTPTFVESSPILVAGQFAELTLVRAADGGVTGYIGKARVFAMVDALGTGTFSAQQAVANFVVDDTATNQVEASGGLVRDIRIWNVALTDAQIAAI